MSLEHVGKDASGNDYYADVEALRQVYIPARFRSAEELRAEYGGGEDTTQGIADAIYRYEVGGAITDAAIYGCVYRDANGLRIPAKDVIAQRPANEPVEPGPLDRFFR